MRGKVNAVTMDQCSKTALVFENVVASCEIVNSRSVQVSVPQTPSSPDSPLCSLLCICLSYHHCVCSV